MQIRAAKRRVIRCPSGSIPARPREVVPPNLMRLQTEERIQLDEELFAKNVRSARRGAAPGPSGMAAEHFFPLLVSTHTLETLCEVVGFFARAEVPESVLPALRLGRMTALKKPSEGARGIVVTDSSFAEAHRVLLSEPTHVEDEDEDQENEKEGERDGEECKRESRREVRTNTAHEAWMT